MCPPQADGRRWLSASDGSCCGHSWKGDAAKRQTSEESRERREGPAHRRRAACLVWNTELTRDAWCAREADAAQAAARSQPGSALYIAPGRERADGRAETAASCKRDDEESTEQAAEAHPRHEELGPGEARETVFGRLLSFCALIRVLVQGSPQPSMFGRMEGENSRAWRLGVPPSPKRTEAWRAQELSCGEKRPWQWGLFGSERITQIQCLC